MSTQPDDGLTESERAILAELGEDDDDIREDDGDDGDDSQGASIDGKGAGKDDDGGDDDDGEDGGAQAGQNAKGNDTQTAGNDGDGDGDDGEPEPEPVKRADAPIYTAETPADADAKLKEIAQARRQARKDYEEGTLDEEQYDAKLDELDQQRDKINRAITRAEVSAEMTQQQLAKSYTQTVDAFIGDMKRAGIDYRDPKNAAQAAFLNERVKALAGLEHEQTPEAWRQLLDDAHALTARKFNIQTKAPEAKSNTPGKSGKQAPENRKPDLTGIPPTVGRGPGAANASAGGDEFAHLEGLSGIALEREVSKMTPEQLDRYLS